MKKPDVIHSPVDPIQYHATPQRKLQIIGHHTVSGPGVAGDIAWWNKNKDRVCTPYIISRDGTTHQCFDETYWAWALGTKRAQLLQMNSNKSRMDLEKAAIHIELDSWGGLVKRGGHYYNGYGGRVDAAVVDYGNDYRGFRYFEKYTDKQLAAFSKLLCYLCTTYSIPVDYHMDVFRLSKRALNGERGFFSHASFRPDKSDLHPQPELIQMLRNLNA
jgi:N-acetyl-anhydromuramyl-L-alanine amidase AmpD